MRLPGIAQVCGKVGPWPWWPSEHSGRSRRVSEEVMLFGMTDLFRIGLAGRDIGVDEFATELVVDRRLTHKVTL